MLRRSQTFTPSKQVVRDLQCDAIHAHMASRLGRLRYFGLPSSSLQDVAQWSPLLESITAVERGEPGREWILQNELLVNAFKLGISHKLVLLRGDIDEILITGKDTFGSAPTWPYDIVSLDYSGGLFYRDAAHNPRRLEAIKQVFVQQAASGAPDFVFFLSFNLDQVDQHEVRESLKVMERDLKRFGRSAGSVMAAYLAHPKEQARLKLYVMNLTAQLAAQSQFDSDSEPPIFYVGNIETEMMAFRCFFKKSTRTFVPRAPKERLHQIVNRRMIEIVDGKQVVTNLGLPLIKAEAKHEN